nr:MAG TPA: hypothetical protein [Caudoviricetes sp.]
MVCRIVYAYLILFYNIALYFLFLCQMIIILLFSNIQRSGFNFGFSRLLK